MSSKQINSDDYGYYVDNLLFNHDIELLSQFVQDMSFEKRKDFAFFTEEDFKGKTDFSLNIEVENEKKSEEQIVTSLSVNLEAEINKKTAFILEMTYCGLLVYLMCPNKYLKSKFKLNAQKFFSPT